MKKKGSKTHRVKLELSQGHTFVKYARGIVLQVERDVKYIPQICIINGVYSEVYMQKYLLKVVSSLRFEYKGSIYKGYSVKYQDNIKWKGHCTEGNWRDKNTYKITRESIPWNVSKKRGDRGGRRQDRSDVHDNQVRTFIN